MFLILYDKYLFLHLPECENFELLGVIPGSGYGQGLNPNSSGSETLPEILENFTDKFLY